MSRNPWEEFCIAIAGPLVNVVIAMVLGVFVLGGFDFIPNVVDSLLWRFLSVLLALNIPLLITVIVSGRWSAMMAPGVPAGAASAIHLDIYPYDQCC
jgi:Zn-dependent protease